jgi:hypothetical protein
MKRAVLIFTLLVAIGFVACKKVDMNNSNTNTTNYGSVKNTFNGLKKSDSLTTGLFGIWELTKRYGGNIMPADFKPSNGTEYQFNSDSTYKHYQDGTLNDSGVFHIVKNALKYDTVAYNVIYFNNDNSLFASSIITMNSNQLTLAPRMPDFARTVYIKTGN